MRLDMDGEMTRRLKKKRKMMKRPVRTERAVRAYVARLRKCGMVEEEVADLIEDGLTAGYESDFDDEALHRGRSVLAVEMAEMRLSDMEKAIAEALEFLGVML